MIDLFERLRVKFIYWRKNRLLKKGINLIDKFGSWYSSESDGLEFIIRELYIKRYESILETYGEPEFSDINNPNDYTPREVLIRFNREDKEKKALYNFWKYRYPKYKKWSKAFQDAIYDRTESFKKEGFRESKIYKKEQEFEETLYSITMDYLKRSVDVWDGLID
jgi:hypothetical protein